MSLNLRRPLIILDLETTGVNITQDRIIELAFLKIFPDGKKEEQTYLFNPGVPIPESSSAIHGIYDADVADKPLFKQKAKELELIFEGCDLGGFNSNKFDIPMLAEEFLRCDIDFDTLNRKFVDVQRIYHIMEQRTLAAAYKFYCDKELTDAHRALADVKATYEVLQAQLSKYSELKNDMEFLHTFSGYSKNIDLAGRLVRDDKGEPIFNFGKYKGRPVKDVFKKEPSYYSWMMDGEFALDTKKIITKLYLELANR